MNILRIKIFLRVQELINAQNSQAILGSLKKF